MDIKPLRINILEQLAHYMMDQVEFDNEPWFHDIKRYFQSEEFTKGSQPSDRKFIRKIANKFFLSGQTLYKKSFDLILLRCVDATESEQIMKEIHEGECGPHMNGHLLARKIMRWGCYWMTM